MSHDYMHKTVVVDGWKILINHPDPDTAWKIGIELTKLFGDSAADIGMKIAKAKDDKEKDEILQNSIPKAIKTVTQNLDPSSSLVLIKKVLRHCEIQGHEDGTQKKVLLDDVGFKTFFHGRMGTLNKLLVEALMFTHADFFGAMMGSTRTIQA
jgi:hypothetical protein